MKKIFIIDGGAGRNITAIPALLKFNKNNPDVDWHILATWPELFYGIKEFDGRVHNSEAQGIFEYLLKDADEVVHPEIYQNPRYYRQEYSMAETFDEMINNTHQHDDLPQPTLKLLKQEQINSFIQFKNIRNQAQGKKIVVIQPFGQSSQLYKSEEETNVIDHNARGLSSPVYLEIVKQLSQKYFLIFFGQKDFYLPNDEFTMKLPDYHSLRDWMCAISNADYFIGVDSSGQHMARAFNIPGSVIYGSTFPENTSYPEYFNVLVKDGKKVYAPIRLSQTNAQIADIYNEDLISFNKNEINEIVHSIGEHIEQSTQEN